jgi:hypothetical protein
MKSWIRKLMERAGCCTLVAAGTLGWTSVTAAQNFATLPAGPVGHVHSAAAEAPPALDSYGKLAEMKVELAWLADPVTFPYHLAARADGAMLEVRGYVPNEAVREQALKVAREHSGLNVVDVLQIYDYLALRSVGRPVEELQQAAREMLAESLKDLARGLDVKARSNGQLVVEGMVPSFEGKLLVSQCLRRVGGCTGVQNELHLLTVQQSDGKSYTLVSADGSHMVPSEGMTPEPAAPPVPAVRPHEVAVPQRMVPTPAAPVSVPRVEPSKPRTEQTVSLVPRLEPANKNWYPIPVRPEETVSNYAATETPAPQPSTVRVPTVPLALPPEVSRPVQVAPPAAPAPTTPRLQPAPLPADSRRWVGTSDLVVKPVAPVATKPPQPVATPKASAVQPAKAYVTTGTISFDEPEPQIKPAAVAVDLPALQTRLKQQIVTTCGVPAKDVDVKATSAKNLEVRLKSRSISEGEKLSEKLFRMPELGPYQVSLDVQIAP